MVVEWSPNANEDMAGIWEYYSPLDIRAAAKIMRDIRTAALSLGGMPLMAPVEPLLDGSPYAYRSLVAGRNYKVIYRVDGETVYVTAVWDCRRDPARLRDEVRERRALR